MSLQKVSLKQTMTRMDAARLGKGFGYMIWSIKKKPELEYISSGMVMLEHHFNNHVHCGPWCPRKCQTLSQQNASKCQTLSQQNASGRYCRCKEKDAKLYSILKEKVNRFITLDQLREVAHGMDIQPNESFNDTISWFAPKNKAYCGSGSLTNHVSLAIGIWYQHVQISSVLQASLQAPRNTDDHECSALP
jgi:hypothetical protein